MGKISNYTRALVAKLQDVFVVDQTDNNVTTTKSVTVEQIGDTIAGTQTHSTLTTSDKTLIGAINEASSSGGVDELDELTDVTITSATLGDNLRSDGNGGWVNAKQVVEMTNAQWSAISDKATWRSNHKNTLLVLTDAPNLNATAQDISYDGSTTTVKQAIDGKMAIDKIKTYNWVDTNVAVTTLYSGGNMYYCDITFPSGHATDSTEILALTMVDYGGLSDVLQFQIKGARAFRIWSKTSMTLSTLTVKVLYFT